LAEVEATLRDLVAQGEVIEWAPELFRSRIAETVRCLRLLRQRLWWQRTCGCGGIGASSFWILTH
jgi:hypothetical protein